MVASFYVQWQRTVHPAQAYSPNVVEKPSEKGYEQRSEREFGRYTKGEMDRKPLLCGPQGYAAGASEAFRTVSELDFGHLQPRGVGYARHRNLPEKR